MRITSHSYPVARLAISAVDWHPAKSGKDQYTDGQISTEDWNSVGVSGLSSSSAQREWYASVSSMYLQVSLVVGGVGSQVGEPLYHVSSIVRSEGI